MDRLPQTVTFFFPLCRWTRVIDELRGVKTTDEQISRVINILQESHTFLSIAASTYNAIFTK